MKDAWERIHNKIEEKDQFLRKIWFDTWCNYNEKNSEADTRILYELITVNDEFDAIIPYCFEKETPFIFASLAGHISPHRGIPNTGVNAELIAKTAQRILEIKDCTGFHFSLVEEADKFIVALFEELKKRKWSFITEPFNDIYGMEVPKTEEEYLKSLSKNARKNISKGRRKLEEAGHVEYKYFTNEAPDIWEKVFKDIAEIEKNSWISEGGEARVGGEENQIIWNKLVTDDWFSQAIKVIIVYLNGEPVCHYLSFDTDNTRYAYDTSYDKKVAKYSVGVQLEVENIKQSIKAGVKYINNSFGSEDFKIQWGRKKFAKTTCVRVFPPTIKGYLAYLIIKGKFFRNSIYSNAKFRAIKRKIFG